MAYSELSPGMAFTRSAIALAVTHGDPREAAAYAANRWGTSSSPALILRSSVGGLEYGSDRLWSEAGRAGVAFLEMIRPRTVIGKIQGLREVPSRTPYVKQTGLATAYWAGEGSARPLSKGAFEYDTIAPLTIAALSVMSNELLKSTNPAAELLIHNDLAKAAIQLSDSSFVDPLSAGEAGKSPASILYGVATTTASGNLANDIELAIANFGGDLETAVWLMAPRLAVQIGLRAGVSGVAADLGARGGMLAGLPVITSSACAYYTSDGGQLALVDASAIVMLDEGAEVRITNQATIEMDNAPTGETLTPTGASTAHVNLFQTDSSAILVSRRINWELAGSNAVVVLAGVDYPA